MGWSDADLRRDVEHIAVASEVSDVPVGLAVLERPRQLHRPAFLVDAPYLHREHEAVAEGALRVGSERRRSPYCELRDDREVNGEVHAGDDGRIVHVVEVRPARTHRGAARVTGVPAGSAQTEQQTSVAKIWAAQVGWD